MDLIHHHANIRFVNNSVTVTAVSNKIETTNQDKNQLMFCKLFR